MIISEKLCKKITTTLVENNLIDPYLYDAYYYCFDFLLDILLFAPIEPQNKKYTIENRIKAKKICIILSIFIYLFLLIMLILKKSCFANLTMMCIIITVINQIIGLYQRNGGTNNDSEYCHMR